MAEFELEITTPERQFLKEPVQMVILPGENGELGVMAGHAPLVLVLKSGTVRIKQNDEWRECVTADGYAMVDRKRVLLLCQMAEWPEEIDERLAREEEAREKEKLRQAQSPRHGQAPRGIPPQHQQPVNAPKKGSGKPNPVFRSPFPLFSPP